MSKESIRRRVRARLNRAGVGRFPGEQRRVPNFRGAETAASLLRQLTIWRRAKSIRCDSSAPQIWLRRAALAEGKKVYVAVGNLRGERCFLELDPDRLGARGWRAASTRGAGRLGRPVTPDQLPILDLVVTGAVAVNRQGAMLGGGGGGFDLEYGLLRDLGKIREFTPVVTTLHSVQVVDDRIPMRPHDVPVDFAVTPETVIAAPSLYPRPRGVFWELLGDERARSIPVALRGHRERSSKPTPNRI